MTAHSWSRRRREPDPGPLLMDAVDAIANMAQRVLTWALYRTAEALALCGLELEDVLTEVYGGYSHGSWLKDEEVCQ